MPEGAGSEGALTFAEGLDIPAPTVCPSTDVTLYDL